MGSPSSSVSLTEDATDGRFLLSGFLLLAMNNVYRS